jgi:hypothetical protein
MLGVEINEKNADKLSRKMVELKSIDSAKVGRTVKTDMNYIKSEFEKEVAIVGGMGPSSTLHDINRAKAVVNHKLQEVDSLFSVKEELSQIELPQPQPWEF